MARKRKMRKKPVYLLLTQKDQNNTNGKIASGLRRGEQINWHFCTQTTEAGGTQIDSRNPIITQIRSVFSVQADGRPSRARDKKTNFPVIL